MPLKLYIKLKQPISINSQAMVSNTSLEDRLEAISATKREEEDRSVSYVLEINLC